MKNIYKLWVIGHSCHENALVFLYRTLRQCYSYTEIAILLAFIKNVFLELKSGQFELNRTFNLKTQRLRRWVLIRVLQYSNPSSVHGFSDLFDIIKKLANCTVTNRSTDILLLLLLFISSIEPHACFFCACVDIPTRSSLKVLSTYQFCDVAVFLEHCCNRRPALPF